MTPSTLQADFKPRIIARLDEVAGFLPGWDGTDVPPPRADILAAVRQWVDRPPDRAAFARSGRRSCRWHRAKCNSNGTARAAAFWSWNSKNPTGFTTSNGNPIAALK